MNKDGDYSSIGLNIFPAGVTGGEFILASSGEYTFKVKADPLVKNILTRYAISVCDTYLRFNPTSKKC